MVILKPIFYSFLFIWSAHTYADKCDFKTSNNLKTLSKYNQETNACCLLENNHYIVNENYSTLDELIQSSNNEIISWLKNQVQNIGENEFSIMDQVLKQKIILEAQEYIQLRAQEEGRQRSIGLAKEVAKNLVISIIKNFKSLVAERLKSAAFYASLSSIAKSAGLSLLKELFVGNHSYRKIDLLVSEVDPQERLKLLVEVSAMHPQELCHFISSSGAAYSFNAKKSMAFKKYENSMSVVDNLIIPFFQTEKHLIQTHPQVPYLNYMRCSRKDYEKLNMYEIANLDNSREVSPICYEKYEKEKIFIEQCSDQLDDNSLCRDYYLGYYPYTPYGKKIGFTYLNGKNVNSVTLRQLTLEDNFIPLYRNYIKEIYQELLESMTI
jgi:hypothetical protein